MKITHERLLSLLNYDPETGIFTNRVTRGVSYIGSVVGKIDPSIGYIQLRVDNQRYLGHILAWFHFYGVWPSMRLDHKDTVRHHNWINNLREATQSQNLSHRKGCNANSATGVRGVKFSGNGLAFIAQIQVNYKMMYLGTFELLEEAKECYEAAARHYFGEFYEN